MSADVPQIGDIVRSARDGLGLSQIELAQKSGITKHTIWAMETNRSFPSHDVLRKLVLALDITADQIVVPDRVVRTIEQEQFFSKYLGLDDYEEGLVNDFVDSLYRQRALRCNVPEKQS